MLKINLSKLFRTSCKPSKSKNRKATSLTFLTLEARCTPATFKVTSALDDGGVNPNPGDGTGTLRQALIDANANGTGADDIVFGTLFNTLHTIMLENHYPAITGSSTITGTDKANILIDGYDGSSKWKAFTSSTNSLSITISDISITNTSASGIAITGNSSLTISNAEISTTSFTDHGGGIKFASGSTLTVDNVYIHGTEILGKGGGIYVSSSGAMPAAWGRHAVTRPVSRMPPKRLAWHPALLPFANWTEPAA